MAVNDQIIVIIERCWHSKHSFYIFSRNLYSLKPIHTLLPFNSADLFHYHGLSLLTFPCNARRAPTSIVSGNRVSSSSIEMRPNSQLFNLHYALSEEIMTPRKDLPFSIQVWSTYFFRAARMMVSNKLLFLIIPYSFTQVVKTLLSHDVL